MQRKFAAFSLFISLFLSISCRASWAAPLATVQTATQSTWKKRGTSTFAALNRRTSLDSGDIVRTGAQGKASLLFVDGSQVRLDQNATIEITAPTETNDGKSSFFRALSGQVWVRLRPSTPVRTRTAVAGVQGYFPGTEKPEQDTILPPIDDKAESEKAQPGANQSLAAMIKAARNRLLKAQSGVVQLGASQSGK